MSFVRVDLVMWACFAAGLGHGGGIYWTDRGAGELKHMNFDGSNLQSIPLSGSITNAGSNLRGVAVDTLHERLVWADNGIDRLLVSNLDGSNSSVLLTLGGGAAFPADIRLDLRHGMVYWCDQMQNSIGRAGLDGTGTTVVITNAADTGPYFMDVDLEGEKIYWADFDGGSIFRANLDGSSREKLVEQINKTRGVRVDREGGMLYWVNRDDKKIQRCPLSALSNGSIAANAPEVQTLYSGLDTPHGLTLDLPARRLYWADTGTNPGEGTGGGAVSRGDLDGSAPLEVLAVGVEPWDVDLDPRCSSYEEWRLRFFRRDAPATQTSPEADPDGDGISNLQEYAHGLSPVQPNGLYDGTPGGSLQAGASEPSFYPSISFKFRGSATDLSYEVFSLTDLLTTNTSAASISQGPLDEGLVQVTVFGAASLSQQPRQFMKLVLRLEKP